MLLWNVLALVFIGVGWFMISVSFYRVSLSHMQTIFMHIVIFLPFLSGSVLKKGKKMLRTILDEMIRVCAHFLSSRIYAVAEAIL